MGISNFPPVLSRGVRLELARFRSRRPQADSFKPYTTRVQSRITSPGCSVILASFLIDFDLEAWDFPSPSAVSAEDRGTGEIKLLLLRLN